MKFLFALAQLGVAVVRKSMKENKVC